MSRTQRLFRIIWRINALLILVASALAVLGFGALWASQLVRHARRDEIEAATGAARWLLGSDDEVIAETEEVRKEAGGERGEVLVATVVLVKPPADDLERVDGRLLVFDPIARRIEQVATIDTASLARVSEQIVTIPPLE